MPKCLPQAHLSNSPSVKIWLTYSKLTLENLYGFAGHWCLARVGRGRRIPPDVVDLWLCHVNALANAFCAAMVRGAIGFAFSVNPVDLHKFRTTWFYGLPTNLS